MRKLVLIAPVVLASARAQAGEPRSLPAYPVSHDTTATVGTQPVASKSLRADNDTSTQPVETPRYSLPPADTTSNPPPAETPHYTARPAPVDNAPRATTTTPTTQTPSSSTSPREVHGRHMRAERPHHGHWSAGRIIATLHRYGIYW